MNLTPTKREKSTHLLKEKLYEFKYNVSFFFDDFAHLIYEILKLAIVVCLVILVIRAPRVFIVALSPVIFFIFPFILINILSKLLSFIFKFFV